MAGSEEFPKNEKPKRPRKKEWWETLTAGEVSRRQKEMDTEYAEKTYQEQAKLYTPYEGSEEYKEAKRTWDAGFEPKYNLTIDKEVTAAAAKTAGIRKAKTPQTTNMTPPPPKNEKKISVTDEALEKERGERKIENILKTMRPGNTFIYMGAPAKLVSFDRTNDEIKFETRTGEKTYKKEEFQELLKNNEFQKANEASYERKETIDQIAEYIKTHKIDRVVVHGEPRFIENPDTGEQDPVSAAELDFDTETALYFLNYGQDFKQQKKGQRGSSTIYNAGADTEFVMKGEKSKLTRPAMKNGAEVNEQLKKGSLVLHIDTGEQTLSVEKDGETIMAFADHHKEIDNVETSATEMIYQTMIKAKAYEEEPWMKNVVDYANRVDNLSYANLKTFTPGFFKEQWPKSLYSLEKFLPYTKIIELIKEGRDPANPFTEEELDTVTTTIPEKNKATGKYENKKVTMRQLITLRGNHAHDSIKFSGVAAENMKAQGISTESALLGKTLFGTMNDETDTSGKKIPGTYLKEGYLAAKAQGYDTFVSYSKEKDSFFVNSTTKDLRPIIAEIRKIVPGAKLIRGVMILPGKKMEGRDKLTKEKLLEICGLTNKDTKLNTYSPKVKALSEKAQAFQKEKARLKLEQEIVDLQKKIETTMREEEEGKYRGETIESALTMVDEELAELDKLEKQVLAEEEKNNYLETTRKLAILQGRGPENTKNKPKKGNVKKGEELIPYKKTGEVVHVPKEENFEEEMRKYLVEQKKLDIKEKPILGTLTEEKIAELKKKSQSRLEELANKVISKEDIEKAAKERDQALHEYVIEEKKKEPDQKRLEYLRDILYGKRRIYKYMYEKYNIHNSEKFEDDFKEAYRRITGIDYTGE